VVKVPLTPTISLLDDITYNYNNDFTSCFGYNDIYVAIKRTTALITDSSGQNYFTISNGGYCTKIVNGVLTDSGDILGGGGGIQSYVGMIIYSSTLDTNEKVVAVYGGTTWTKIEDKFLLGASSTYAVNSTGGTTSHSHGKTSGGGGGSLYSGNGAVMAAVSHMPPYRAVYIWERTA